MACPGCARVRCSFQPEGWPDAGRRQAWQAEWVPPAEGGLRKLWEMSELSASEFADEVSLFFELAPRHASGDDGDAVRAQQFRVGSCAIWRCSRAIPPAEPSVATGRPEGPRLDTGRRHRAWHGADASRSPRSRISPPCSTSVSARSESAERETTATPRRRMTTSKICAILPAARRSSARSTTVRDGRRASRQRYSHRAGRTCAGDADARRRSAPCRRRPRTAFPLKP